MIFKVLKHKTIEGLFGFPDTQMGEILHGTKPDLLGNAATMEALATYYRTYPIILEQLPQYELVDVYVSTENIINSIIGETVTETVLRDGTKKNLMLPEERLQWQKELKRKYFSPEHSVEPVGSGSN